jgi:hypothetical protein
MQVKYELYFGALEAVRSRQFASTFCVCSKSGFLSKVLSSEAIRYSERGIAAEKAYIVGSMRKLGSTQKMRHEKFILAIVFVVLGVAVWIIMAR